MANETNISESNSLLVKLNKLSSNKFFMIIAILVIIIANITIYSNIFDNSIHFDDEFVFKNPDLQDPGNFEKLFSINKFRLVPFWTFAYNYSSSNQGQDLSGFYTTNITIHIINSLLVFGIIFLIMRTPVIRDTKIAKYSAIIAFLGSLLFACHPLQTQAVTYIYQRLASIAALFYFGAIFSYLAGRITEKGKLIKVALFLFSFVFLILGLFSKENVFTIFPMILLIELMLFNKNFKISPAIAGVFIGLIVIGIFIFLQFQVPSDIFKPLENFNGETITSQNYFITQFKVLPVYFRLFIFPIGQNFDHDIRISNSIFDFDVITGIAIILLLLGFALYMYKYNRLITFGILWTFLTIAVESSIIPIADVIFEHRVYLPMLGLVLALIGLLYEIFSRKEQLIPILFILLFIIGITNGVLANQRNNVWNTERTLWADVVSKSPNKARAHFKKGQADLIDGKVNIALDEFNKTIKIRPEFISAYTYRAAIYLTLDKNREALADQNKFIELSKDKTQGYLNRARTYVVLKQLGKAIEDYKLYLKKNNLDSDTFLELAGIYEQINDAVNAVKTAQQAYNVDSTNYKAMYNIGRYYFMRAKFDSALVWLDKAEKSPKVGPGTLSNVYNIRGNYYFFNKDYNKSIEEYQKALSLNPKFMLALVNLAIVYRNLGEYNKELDVINKIIEIEPRNDLNWQYRGFCNINLKNYKEAESDLRRALELNRTNKEANAKLFEIQKFLN